jgi:Rab3 GTPase-activating protein regulatory subunit N-terminus
MSSSVSLLVAYTKHTISAQLFSVQQHGSSLDKDCIVPNEIKEICMLHFDETENGNDWQDQHEQISCVTVLSLPSQQPPQNGASLAVPTAALDPMALSSSSSSGSITSTSSLMKGVVLVDSTTNDNPTSPNNEAMREQDQDDVLACVTQVTSFDGAQTSAQRHVAVVFGTTASRLYTVQVVVSMQSDKSVHWERWQIVNDSTRTKSSLFSVFPMDNVEVDHASSWGYQRQQQRRRSWKRRLSTGNGANTGSDFAGATATSAAGAVRRVPFSPRGGVVSVTAHDMTNYRRGTTVTTITTTTTTTWPQSLSWVWIVYGDATLVRVQGAALFPSLWQQAAAQERSVEDECRQLADTTAALDESSRTDSSRRHRLNNAPGQAPPILVRCRVHLPVEGAASCADHHHHHHPVLIVPLPRRFPAPLSPLTALVLSRLSGDSDTSRTSAQTKVDDVYEALVFGKCPNNLLPTLSFYSSECRWDAQLDAAAQRMSEATKSAMPAESNGRLRKQGNEDVRILESVTKALVGSAIGALRWGLGGSMRNVLDASLHANTSIPLDSARNGNDGDTLMADSSQTMDQSAALDEPLSPFPSLWKPPVPLYSYEAFHDAPRKIEFCCIDPDGTLAAATDGLGRVLLIDLSTKQLIRMWKGFREASCYWLQTMSSPPPEKVGTESWRPSKKPLLHLVIHSRQRRVVEAWRVRHGSRVFSSPVGRDAKVLQFTSWSPVLQAPLAQCYLLDSTIPGTNHMALIQVGEQTTESTDASSFNTPPHSVVSMTDAASVASTPSKTNALRLKRLQQLLSAGNIVCSKENVRNSLHEITSLADLSTALDLLATASVLEERFDVHGSSFQKDALTYCRSIWNAAIHRGKPRSDATSRENPHIQVLAHKIEYHSQVRKCRPLLVSTECHPDGLTLLTSHVCHDTDCESV